MSWNRTGTWRFLRPRYLDKTAPCSEACPVGQDIPKIEILLAQGAFEEAWLRLREENPLPGVCGRVCFHPCERSCNRKEYDEPVSINGLERFLADHAWKQGIPPPPVAEPATGKRIAVVGGGDTAMDVARTLLRLGSHPEIVYRRRVEDMPAHPEEIEEAREEGIPFRTLLSPSRIRTAADGLLELELTPMRSVEGDGRGRARAVPSGEPTVTMKVSAVFSAVGASHSEGVPREWADPSRTVPIGPHLRLLPEGAWKGRTPVFLGGDLVNDAKTVVTAIASGKEAAVAIDASFRGIAPERVLSGIRIGEKGAISMNRYLDGDRGKRQDHVVRFEEINAIYFESLERKARPRVTLGERRTGFDEVKMRISGSMAIREAERCFHCGLCDQCDNCHLFCPDIAVLRDPRTNRREIDYDYCKGCGVCVVECPRNAMVLEEEPG